MAFNLKGQADASFSHHNMLNMYLLQLGAKLATPGTCVERCPAKGIEEANQICRFGWTHSSKRCTAAEELEAHR